MNELQLRRNAEIKALQYRINQRLKEFTPSGRFVDEGFGSSIFHSVLSSLDGGLREAQEIADEMAGEDFEVRVDEVMGGEQRFVASILRYNGNWRFPEDREFRPDEYR
jgi:hypothetical protein